MEGIISFGLFYAVKGEKFCPFQDFQGPQPKVKDFQGLEFSFANSRTFEDLKDRCTWDVHLSVRLVATVREWERTTSGCIHLHLSVCLVATARGRDSTVSISASTAEGINSIFPGGRTYT